MHWPFKNYQKTYTVKKSANQLEEKFITIAEKPSSTFNEIYCRIQDIQNKEYSFYIVIVGSGIYHELLRTKLYVTLTENSDETKVKTITKTNPAYPGMLLVIFAFTAIGMIRNWPDIKQGFINLAIVFFLCWGLDFASKKILQATFERFI